MNYTANQIKEAFEAGRASGLKTAETICLQVRKEMFRRATQSKFEEQWHREMSYGPKLCIDRIRARMTAQEKVDPDLEVAE